MMLSQISQPIKQMVCNAKDMDILKIRRGGHICLMGSMTVKFSKCIINY